MAKLGRVQLHLKGMGTADLEAASQHGGKRGVGGAAHHGLDGHNHDNRNDGMGMETGGTLKGAKEP